VVRPYIAFRTRVNVVRATTALLFSFILGQYDGVNLGEMRANITLLGGDRVQPSELCLRLSPCPSTLVQFARNLIENAFSPWQPGRAYKSLEVN
jgi:hypothetical protein